jgi:hypothetical protein
LVLTPLGGGAFRLDGGDGWWVAARPAGGGWILEATTGLAGARLDPSPGAGGGFVLAGGRAREELGWTSGLAGGDVHRQVRYLVAGDGRVFRIVLRGPRDARYDLVSWECPGPYLTARLDGDGWRVEVSTAGQELPSPEAVVVLFAVELAALGPGP